jgi:hypothetical protein
LLNLLLHLLEFMVLTTTGATATHCTKDGCRVRPASGVGKPDSTPEGERKAAESKIY